MARLTEFATSACSGRPRDEVSFLSFTMSTWVWSLLKGQSAGRDVVPAEIVPIESSVAVSEKCTTSMENDSNVALVDVSVDVVDPVSKTLEDNCFEICDDDPLEKSHIPTISHSNTSPFVVSGTHYSSYEKLSEECRSYVHDQTDSI